jgi:hypothetical protein
VGGMRVLVACDLNLHHLILLSHKNSTWGIFLYINHKV